MAEQYKDRLGLFAMSASKIIEYTDGKAELLKDKKRDIESSTGVVMHFTLAEVKMLEMELRTLSRLRGKGMAAGFIRSAEGSVPKKNQ